MGKKQKKNLADRINNKNKAKHVKKFNPFEVHINRQKMQVLGQKSKNDRGLPGVSRAKALNKRKNTLLVEYKTQNKSNKFIDRRIGERNADLSENDRAIARFAAQRSKEYKKKFVLDDLDTEVLTHRGQTLTEIEKFEDPRSDDEDSIDFSENKTGKLDANFVEDVHFGGGVLTKTGIEGAKSHKDLINELINESKKRKAEKQKTKEKTLELTEKLDSEWKDLIPLLKKNVVDKSKVEKKPDDDYDMLLRKFDFQSVRPATDRLKSVDEIAKEEKDKLEQLEKDRLARMKGFDRKKASASKHKSADDLDDDFAFDDGPEVMLTYNEEGVSNIVPEEQNQDEEQNEEDDESEDEVETASEDDFSDLKDESSESEDEEITKKRKMSCQESDIGTKKQKGDDSSESDAESTTGEIEKVNEDAEDDDSSESDKESTTGERKIRKVNEDTNDSDNESEMKEEIKEKDRIREQEQIMEKARKELPYTFEVSKSYEDLQKTLSEQSPEHHSVIIERMIKCNHPSLADGNKEKLEMLFVYLLQYINDISCDNNIKNCFKLYNSIIPHIFDLSQLTKVNSHTCIREVLVEKQSDYRKNRKKFPDVDVLMFLKMISCVFPTSDFRHSIVTPTFVFIEQMLTTCKVKTCKDVAYGLFLITLVSEYTHLSKRYLPAALRFLAGLLHMAIPKVVKSKIKVLPPFNSLSTRLVQIKDCSSSKISLKMDSTDLTRVEAANDFKIRSLYTSLKLIGEFRENFEALSSNCEIFDHILQYLQLIPIKKYPKEVQKELNNLISNLKLDKSERKLDYIVMEAAKPKALRLYEPNIQKVYDFKRHKNLSRERAEQQKLLYKVKKERKGALREIRKDRNFLGRVKINEKIRGDQQRKKKVKQIYAEASVQQGELKKLDRKKKWKK